MASLIVGIVDTIGRAFDIGSPDVTTYRDMLITVAKLMGRRRLIVPVPVLSPRLSSHWLNLVTDVDMTTARSLVDSLSNEVVVRDHSIESVVGTEAHPYRPLAFSAAAAAALAAREHRLGTATTHAPA